MQTPDCLKRWVRPVQLSLLASTVIAAVGFLHAGHALADTKEFTFRQLGYQTPLNIRGVDGQVSVPFSVRADEVVTSGSVKLRYTYSPALLEKLSHFNVIVNGEVVKTFALSAAEAGNPQERTVDIPVRLLTDYNNVNLQLVGHYTTDCEDPAHSSLWLNVSNQSTLTLNSTLLPSAEDLAALPAPFFDARDMRPLAANFVFAGTPGNGTLEAGATVGSWLGSLSSYRGSTINAMVDNLPEQGHTVLFQLGARGIPGIQVQTGGATIAVRANPANPKYRVLVVAGSNEQELKLAAKALVTGSVVMTGDTVRIAESDLKLQPRKPYDAPRWLSSERPTPLGDLVGPAALQVAGQYPAQIRVPVSVPPDLFFWRSKGIPLDLKYRYTLRKDRDKSTLNISYSDRFIQALPLGAVGDSTWIERFVRERILRINDFPNRTLMHMPRDVFAPRGELGMYFHFDIPKAGACQDVVLQNIEGAVDPSSTIDISGFPKYIQMPDLAAFANSAFPFSRMADFSQTDVVVSAKPDVAELSQLMTLFALFGDRVGMPVYSTTIKRVADLKERSNHDLLVFGRYDNLNLPTELLATAPADLKDGKIATRVGGGFLSIFDRWHTVETADKRERIELGLTGQRPNAVMMGFESPWDSDRSVVLMTGTDNGLKTMLKALADPKDIQSFKGGVVFVHADRIDAVSEERTYAVGRLPLLIRLQLLMSQSPWLALLGTLGFSVVMALALRLALKARAERRLKQA